MKRSDRVLGMLAIAFASIDLLLFLVAALLVIRSGASLATGLPHTVVNGPAGIDDALAAAERALAPLYVARLALLLAAHLGLIAVGWSLRVGKAWARRATVAWCIGAFAVTAFQCFAAFAGAARLQFALGQLAAAPSLPPALLPTSEISGLYFWLATHAAFPIVLILVAGKRSANR